VTGLERGYRRLLRAYPAWYRRERGEEILDTLLAAAPRGRTWPSVRDCGALILGGLRVRAGQNRRLTTAANLRLAVLFGVALWLTGEVAGDLAFAGLGWLHWVPPGQHFGYAAVHGLVILAAIGAAWFAPRPAVAAISLIAAATISLIAVATDTYPWQGPWWLLGEPAMLAALALLAPGKERMPRWWLWLLGAELVAQMLPWLPYGRFHTLPFFLVPWLNDVPWLIVLAAAVLWAVVDARPAIAAGVCAALGWAIPYATGWYDTGFGGDHVFFSPVAWGAMLAVVMTLRLRRQAVL
jgi:hypothetical protein